MRALRPSRSPAAAVVLVLALAVALGACVPELARPGGSPGASGSGALPVSSGPTPSPTIVPPTPTPVPTFRVYTVVEGDTLLSIARTFDTTARSIAYWNRGLYPNLDPEADRYRPNFIKIGWTLFIIPGAVVDPQTLPDQTPRPASPEPGTSPEPVVTPAPGAGAIVINHGPRDGRHVALTFDMGERLDPALDIVEALIDAEVPATLFVAGDAGTQTPRGRAALQLAATRPDLFDIGNFTWDRPVMTDLDGPAIAEQLVRTETAVSTFAGVTTKPWFRPPGGAWDDDVRDAVGRAGWAYLVLWDIDTLDEQPTAQGGPTADAIEATVVSRVQGGSIVLLHLGGWNTLDALPGILDGIAAKDLEPVTLSEMLVP
jgi:peptidoglycan/xylan/chitin deacetylase (PgdA/CDA1 family)